MVLSGKNGLKLCKMIRNCHFSDCPKRQLPVQKDGQMGHQLSPCVLIHRSLEESRSIEKFLHVMYFSKSRNVVQSIEYLKCAFCVLQNCCMHYHSLFVNLNISPVSNSILFESILYSRFSLKLCNVIKHVKHLGSSQLQNLKCELHQIQLFSICS